MVLANAKRSKYKLDAQVLMLRQYKLDAQASAFLRVLWCTRLRVELVLITLGVLNFPAKFEGS